MNLLTLGIYLVALFVVLTAIIAFLPSGASHPLPNELVEGTTAIFQWLWAFNDIFPVDTLFQTVWYGVLITITLKIVWPSLIWVFNKLRL